jgi:hypothetical protein
VLIRNTNLRLSRLGSALATGVWRLPAERRVQYVMSEMYLIEVMHIK